MAAGEGEEWEGLEEISWESNKKQEQKKKQEKGQKQEEEQEQV